MTVTELRQKLEQLESEGYGSLSVKMEKYIPCTDCGYGEPEYENINYVCKKSEGGSETWSVTLET